MDFSKIEEGHPDYKNGEQPLHFYYNREERIARAPKIVQDYYAGKGPRPVKGLIKPLLATRGNRFMFSSIVVFAAFIWIFSFFAGQNAMKIAGTSAALTAFSFEDNVYASLKFDEIKKSSKSEETIIQVPVHVVFNVYEVNGQIVDTMEIDDIFTGKEMFIRTKFTDYDIIKVSCVVTANDEEKTFSSRIERR